MKQYNQSFDAQASLSVILNMIEKTRNAISDSSHYFLLWGWATMVGCITQYALIMWQYPYHYYAWLITPIALVLHVFFLIRDSKRERVKTYVGEAMMYLWTAVGSSFIVLPFIFAHIGWQYCFPFYILFYGIGTSVSGALLRFKPLLYGGITCFVLSVVSVYMPFKQQILMAAAAILVSYIIPGHWLRFTYRHKQQDDFE